MDEISNNVSLCDSSDNDMLEQDITIESEQPVKSTSVEEMKKSEVCDQRVAEKRGRQDDEEIVEEEDFVTVIRGHKRPNRKDSINNSLVTTGDKNTQEEKHIVCVTGKEILPKQFGMAKLLRSCNIPDIVKMVYKSAFRVLIHFEKRESATKLMNCEKLTNLGYRIQMTDEVSLCYGTLRQIDLETDEKEVFENVSCESEILSVKRLKKLSENGEWIDSETVRICFKSTTLPPYVYGYGCRFKVEPYTFPVSQCSRCWKFGHLSRSCPTNKTICPKCGNQHPNCETSEYVCANCKGPHMAMYKKCPSFLKEKRIRDIMTKENCTYRKGLELYLKEKGTQQLNTTITNTERDKNFESFENENVNYTQIRTYKDAVTAKTNVQSLSIASGSVEKDSSGKENNQQRYKPKNKRLETSTVSSNREKESFNTQPETTAQETKQGGRSETVNSSFKLDFFSIYKKVKDICFSDNTWHVKLQELAKTMFDVCSKLFLKVFKSDDVWKKIMLIFNNG